MSANVNPTNPNAKKKVLMVVANPSTSPITGWPVGFWWAELTHPYWEFIEAGYEVEICSTDGGPLQADGYSDPEVASGYSAHDILSLGFKKSPSHMALLGDTKSVDEVDPKNYDAVFFVGGQSPMITFRGNQKLQKLTSRFFEAGKVTALVCHATCLLLETSLSTGDLLVKGRTWTGFATSEEKFADGFVGKRAIGGIFSVVFLVVGWGAIPATVMAAIGVFRRRCKWYVIPIFLLLIPFGSLLFRGVLWVLERVAQPDTVSTALFWGAVFISGLGALFSAGPTLLKEVWQLSNGSSSHQTPQLASTSNGPLILEILMHYDLATDQGVGGLRWIFTPQRRSITDEQCKIALVALLYVRTLVNQEETRRPLFDRIAQAARQVLEGRGWSILAWVVEAP